jgi:hypothetical protein
MAVYNNDYKAFPIKGFARSMMDTKHHGDRGEGFCRKSE